MKKFLLLFCGLCSLQLFSQSAVVQTPDLAEDEITDRAKPRLSHSATEAIFYSQDFANGIPASWGNRVVNSAGVLLPNGSWEYRGPSTTPDNTTGSRGAQAGAGTPLQSPTAANGFIIFDSDYLDDGGIPNNTGNGIAPAPHVGILRTDTINCTGHPFVELKFNASVRRLDSKFLLAISTNGGVSFSDTIDLYPNLGANVTIARDAQNVVNLSAQIGNQANVVLAFIFQGDNRGSYYWMMDDIILQDLPKHELQFTPVGSAPAHDIIYEASSANHPKEGHMDTSFIVPVFFDSNIWNYGSQTQTNVQFKVEIFDSSSTLITTLTPPAIAVLAPGDTLDFTQLTTPSWVPPGPDVYTFVYTYTTDSIPATVSARDSFNLYISSGFQGRGRMSLDNQIFDNSLGTNALGVDGSGMAIQLDLSLNHPNPQGGVYVPWIDGFELGFSTLTVDGGDVIFEMYDTANFSYTAGFGGPALLSESFRVPVGSSGNTVQFLLSNTSTGSYLFTPDRYFFVVYFFSNNGVNTIRIANDQSFASPDPRHAVMYNSDDQRFYSGYSSSRNFNHPWFRVLTRVDVSNLDETQLTELKLYPNPAKGECRLEAAYSGKFELIITHANGQEVQRRSYELNADREINLDISALSPGAYLVQLKGEKSLQSSRLIVR